MTPDESDLAEGWQMDHHMGPWQRVMFQLKFESLSLTFIKDHLDTPIYNVKNK